MSETKMHKCTRCGGIFPRTHEYFHYSRQDQGTFQSMCKSCRNKYLKERADPEKERERQRKKSLRQYYENPEKHRERHRNWKVKNYEHCVEYSKRYQKEKLKSDPVARWKHQTRGFIGQVFYRGGGRGKRVKELTGLSGPELRDYLLQTFYQTYGYHWDMIEPVDIDHIIPLSTASTVEEVEKLYHFENLRLLKREDNRKKGSLLEYDL